MPTQYETGHAKNVANFHKLIEFVTDYGSDYQPSRSDLERTTLQTLEASAESTLVDVVNNNTAYNNKVNERIAVFSDIRQLSTRLVNALEASKASAETIKDAKVFNRKIQGKRASRTETPVDPDAPAPNTISSSQMSFDQIIQHFTGLKSILETEPSYGPNETDLQIDALETKISEMTSRNKQVASAYTKVSNARIARDQILYNAEDALVVTASDVKKYIKSVYGASSAQYNQVDSLQFRKIGRKKK